MIARLRYFTIGVCVAMALVAPGPAVAQGGDATSALAELLGPGAAAWKLTHARGAGIVTRTDGRIGLLPGQGGSIILQSGADYGPGVEHLLELRFLSPKINSGTIDIRMGRDDATPDRKPLAFFLSVANEASLRYDFRNHLVETPVKGVVPPPTIQPTRLVKKQTLFNGQLTGVLTKRQFRPPSVVCQTTP